MSKQYLKKFGIELITKEEMRNFSSRPGRTDENGKIEYTTEQSHKKECDVNNIIKKYDKTGLISHVSKIEGQYGDMSGRDFKDMSDKIAGAKTMFNQLPAEIKKRFENTPEKLLEFMEKSENRDEAISLGLINPLWTEETDGLGEHVPDGKNIKKTTPKTEPKTADSEAGGEV